MSRLCTCILSVFSLICTAQPHQMDEEVENRFAQSDSIHWTTVYSGTWNDFHPVEIILSYNGSEYHGAIRYLSSNMQYDLVGEDTRDGRAVLFEVDFASRNSGIINGEVTDVRISGLWNTIRNDREYNFSATAEAVIPLQKFTPGATSYAGTEDGSSMIVLKEAPRQISGQIIRGGATAAALISGECSDTPCRKWKGRAYTHDRVLANLEVKPVGQGEILVSWEDPTGKSTRTEMVESATVPLAVKSFVHYAGCADLAYIDFPVPAFRDWISEKTASWWQSSLAAIRQFEPADMKVSERQQLVWSGWMEIGYLDTETATGLLVLTGPDVSHTRSFALDRKKGEMIPVESFFKKNVDLPSFTKSWADKRRNTLMTGGEPDYDEWIRKAAFQNICFRKDGMALQTDFNPVFGIAELVIPYAEIRGSLRRKSLITGLMNQ